MFDKLINKSTIFYGDSNSGKTTLIKYILKTFKGKIPGGIVISGTEGENGAFSKLFHPYLIKKNNISSE